MSGSTEIRRLLRNLFPLSYDLHICPDLDKLTFTGNVVVELNVERDTTEIRLHSLDLQIPGVKVTRDDAPILIRSVELFPGREEMVLSLNEILKRGQQIRFEADFAGEINDKLRGFYRTVQSAGRMKYGAVCHFEATGARMAFPCWDDPLYRAIFRLSIDVPTNIEGLVTLSNMPEVARTKIQEKPGWETVTFAETPVIPTYLMCWAIGEYEFIEGKTTDNVPVRAYTPPGKTSQGKFALEVAIKAIDFYREFFGVDYKLPKMDLLALADFPIGAMENWGLLTFRERYLLFDEERSAVKNKQNVALIVAHEVAHQWFGNLVSICWWTHLWLKEGYATWIEFLCVDRLFPQWQIWTQFLTETTNPARALDSLRSSHPIEIEVENPALINEIFDVISYNKGASLIRMLYHWVGEEVFRKGMKNYLERLAFDIAMTDDLWTAMEAESGLNIGDVMSFWTQYPGYPVITVQMVHTTSNSSVDSQAEDIIFILAQHRFLLSEKIENSEDFQQWTVPFSVTSRSSPEKEIFRGVLNQPRQSFALKKSDIRSGDWVNFNPSGVGFYRVLYSNDLIGLFVPSILDRTMPSSDRLTLLNDQLALCQSGEILTTDLMDLLEKYRLDNDFIVWQCIETCLARLREMIQSDPECLIDFQTWCKWLLDPAMHSLGWEGVSAGPSRDQETLFRALVVRNLVRIGDPGTIKQAERRFDRLSGVEADLRPAVCAAKLKTGGIKSFEKLVALTKSAEFSAAEQRIAIYEILGATTDENVLQRALEYSMSDEVRYQDTRSIIAGVATGSKMGSIMAWKFFQARVAEFADRYRQGGLLTNIVRAATITLSEHEDAEEVEKFFAAHPFPGATMTVRQSVETIRLRAKWAERDLWQIKIYLANFKARCTIPM